MKIKDKKINKIHNLIIRYISTNRLFLSYVILTLISSTLLRVFTIGNLGSIKAFATDLALILIIGSLGYLVKPKKQFAYFFTWICIFAFICIVNAVYYVFYMSFATFSLLSALGQATEVGDSIMEKLQLSHFIYFLAPIFFILINKSLKSGNYFNFLNKVEKSKRMMLTTLTAGVALATLVALTITKSEYSQTQQQWNREFIVERFGIILYQGNDLIQNLSPKINQLFGYDEVARNFRDFYCEKEKNTSPTKNKFTNIFEGKNVIFVHMESMQSFVMDLSFNKKEVTPNLNKLVKESIYFDNFYPQISVGTSSDTEFTLLSSLMPALSGTVFVSYPNTYYETILKILKEKGYYTFSMHANKADMWNRAQAHKSLGYDEFYAKPYYEIDDVIGLGLSDKSFFKQVMPMLENIEIDNANYVGTIITLTNHSPFAETDKYGEFDLTANVKRINELTGVQEEIADPYLETSKMGNYLKSVHYADEALGEFIKYVKESSYFDNTIFVLYGDHDARLSKKEFNNLYNYDLSTGRLKVAGDEGYYDYDYYEQQLIKKTPLLIWSKDNKYTGKYSYYMGMIDIMPTLANMMNFDYEFGLGNDIFTIKNNNTIVFPNSNFLTNKVFYNSTKEEYKTFNDTIIDENYIEDKKEYVEKILNISNNIISYDLITNEKDNLKEWCTNEN